ncbi:BZ3500_MvSof-1268-A1-R1_Chr5-3g08329 [Microbotryum saponariae]|uniref:BZ3500_MvSof-1268-A1-R1_Chr5-3g08329 protein n=1 Tax=Microbotryum saponariae TaxID=289078 RepID=A0A2X0KHI6_9BASI|nr:BZ3500_MvSof-1268-A1-R1_Chr5-3g08329 [Microbotryum saponariae]SDA08437.1 BZ3501_MvSof-1269-A2-R1_Chr5-3g08057 [Microbotryum saponariae]
MGGTPISQGVVAPSKLPTLPATSPSASPIPRSVSDTSYATKYGFKHTANGSVSANSATIAGAGANGKGLNGSLSMPRSASAKQIGTTTTEAASTPAAASTMLGIRTFRSRFLGGSIKRGSKIAAPAGPKVVIQAAKPPPLVTTISTHKLGDDSIKDVALLSPQDSDFAPAKTSNGAPQPTRSTSISGNSVGRKRGMFGFRRRTSMPAESISLPIAHPHGSSRFQKQVSRKSIDEESKSATSLVNTRTSPAKVASISASTRLSSALSHDDKHTRDATPPNSSRNSTRSHVTADPESFSPSKRDSSLRLASPSPVPLHLTPVKRGHSEASNVDEWVNAEQSIETPRQRPTSSRVSSLLEVERPTSSTSSLMKQGPPEGLAIHKDSLAPNKDDLAYRRHSISPVLGNFTFPHSSRKSFETRSTGAQSWSRSRETSPLPDEVAGPVGVSEPAAAEDTKAGASEDHQTTGSSEKAAEDSSDLPPLVSFESTQQRPHSQSTVMESRSSMDTFGEPRAQSVLPSPIPDSLRSSLLLDQTGLSKRFSAIEAARKNPAAAMRSVESGSPILVKPEDGFSESPKSSRGPGVRLRARVSSHEEEEEGEAPQFVERMSRSPTEGVDPENLRGKRLSGRSHLASPLEDLVFQLGGRRLSSDGGSLMGPAVASTGPSIRVPEQAVVGGTSPSISIARSASSSSRGHGLSGDDAAALASFPDPDGPLTLDQMEREIDRMEAELALTGGGARSKRFATLGLDDSMLGPMDAATPPPGGVRKSVELAGVLGNSTTSPLTWAAPPLTSSSEMERNPSQTSSNLSSDITPRTARRWSIVEVERAYERMKRILASASSRSVTAMSDSGTINESASELGDVAVEDAFETTLARARAKENPVKAVLGSSDDDDDREELLLTPPPARTRAFSSEQTTPTHRHSGLRGPKISSPSAKALRESVARPGSLVVSPDRAGGVRRTVRTDSSSTGGSLDDAALDDRASRRHTVHESSLSYRSNGDVFDASRNTPERPSGKRGSDTSRLAASTSSIRPATIGSTGTGTSEDGGWATPMSTLRFAQSSVSPRSNDVSRALSSPARSSLQQRSMDELGPRTAAHVRTSTNETTPKRRAVQIAPQERPSSVASEPKVSTGTWYPHTPNRHVHHHREESFSSADERDSLNDTQRTLVDSSDLTMTSVRAMDKLEIFFRYTSVKAELDKAATERDALLDALGETRATLMDVRSQRDALLDELKVEKARRGEQNDTISSDSALAQLEQVRANWEARALDAAEELERAKQEVSAARQEIMDSREREDTLEREVLALEEKVSAMEATQVTLAAGVTSLARRPGSNGTSPRVGSPRVGSPRVGSPRIGGPRAGSIGLGGGAAPPRPPRRVSADDSQSLGGPRSSPSPTKMSALGLPAAPSTPAALFAQAYRIRASSAASSGNVSDDSQGLVDATVTMLDGQGSSPLMEQRASFGPKSSFGSFVGTPLKSRSWGHSSQATTTSLYDRSGVIDRSTKEGTSSSSAPSHTMPKGRSSKSRLPFPFFGVGSPKSRLPSNRLVSKSSMASSATASDFGGDHLPPPSAQQRGMAWDPKASQGSSSGSVGVGKLREDDERFLKDLLQEE